MVGGLKRDDLLSERLEARYALGAGTLFDGVFAFVGKALVRPSLLPRLLERDQRIRSQSDVPPLAAHGDDLNPRFRAYRSEVDTQAGAIALVDSLGRSGQAIMSEVGDTRRSELFRSSLLLISMRLYHFYSADSKKSQWTVMIYKFLLIQPFTAE